MDSTLKKILPLLFRPFETLSILERSKIQAVYKILGREGFEKNLIQEKQTRCYASLVLSQLDDDSEYWKMVHNEYVQRNTAILHIVEKCSKDFYKAGGKTLSVYENYGAVLSSGISIGCFASGDVDFTVSESELELAKKVFKNNDFILDNRDDHAPASHALILPFYNPKALDGTGYWLNIMRKPVARDFMLDQSKTLDRLHFLLNCQLDQYKDTGVRLLNPTAMVYFNALHFASEHYYSASPGMALCCDIDRVVRNRQVDWIKLKQWSDEDSCGLRIQLALDICQYFLHTPIPENIYTIRSRHYEKLWHRLVDEENGFLNPQVSKFSRLVTELLSDDKSLLMSLLNRAF